MTRATRDGAPGSSHDEGRAPEDAREVRDGVLAAARGAPRSLLRHPLPRLLAGGAALALLLHAFGTGASSPAASRTIASTAALPAFGNARAAARATAAQGSKSRPADDELLYRAAADAVSVDDPVVRGRLLRLAQYLEMGGTAEEPGDARAGDGGGARSREDEALIAAAREVGLAGDDVVLRRYLAELARLALAQPSRSDLPGEDELRAWVASHPERFASPARVRARHVYLSATRRKGELAADAATTLARLRGDGVPPERADAFGDPFARGDAIDGAHDVVARAFGEDFARALDALPEGSWQGPVASPFGLHLVWIEERSAAHPATFEEVRGRALHAYLRERGEARAKSRLAELRCRASAASADAVERDGGDACAG